MNKTDNFLAWVKRLIYWDKNTVTTLGAKIQLLKITHHGMCLF